MNTFLSLPGGTMIALLLVAPFLLWSLAKRLRMMRNFDKKNVVAVALIDFVLLPVAAYGIGVMASNTLGAFGLAQSQWVVSEATKLLICFAVAVGVARLLEARLRSKEDDGEKVRLSGLARGALYGFCLFIGLVVFLAINDYAPTEVYVSTGALAALLAFAMQQTLGDLFSGISVSIERPFKIGDWLRFSDGSEGEVIDINWRATRLRGWDNTTYVVPNGQLARQSFTNLHGPNHRFAPWYYVRVSGEADPIKIKALLEAAARRCSSVMADPPPVARLTDGATVPYTYMVWVHFRNYPTMFIGREELYAEIRAALLDAGHELAAEIQEVRLRPAENEAVK